MNRPQISATSFKLILIFALVLIFLIPVMLIKNLVSDRKYYQNNAVSSIIEPLGGKTEIQGMVIGVPYHFNKEVTDKDGNRKTETETRYLIFAPDDYNLDISVKPYYLTRGIFKVPVFNGQINVNASFADFDYSFFDIKRNNIIEKNAVLILGFSNTKNLKSQPKLQINGQELSVSPIKFDWISPFKTSVYYNLSNLTQLKDLNLTGSIDFQGGEDIKIRPVAQNNLVKMASDWKSPSFSGGWLPYERELNENGFAAAWSIAGLSTVYPKSWYAENQFSPESFDVSFMIPIDAYKKTERSVKYALLFLIIPFLALLISELFSSTKIHPVQYCLIGFADVVFYLLLLSISEHLHFDVTYLICSVSVCLATFFYASSIFKNIKWGAMVSCVQLISYIFLYGTLQAEDYALLIGSIGLFVVVVLLMFITRKIDWYELENRV